MSRIVCAIHGEQAETFVCKHVVETLRDDNPRGFFWNDDCAWCSDCEGRRNQGSGEWTDELTQEMGVSLLCGSCFETAKHINGFSRA